MPRNKAFNRFGPPSCQYRSAATKRWFWFLQHHLQEGSSDLLAIVFYRAIAVKLAANFGEHDIESIALLIQKNLYSKIFL
jgi:hypothetical protein